jgi:hypothetical protein
MRLPGAKTEAKSKDAGNTPTTVTGASLIVSFRPTIAGSEANVRCQRAWLRRTAFGPLNRHSSALNDRPSQGLTPSTEKKF